MRTGEKKYWRWRKREEEERKCIKGGSSETENCKRRKDEKELGS